MWLLALLMACGDGESPTDDSGKSTEGPEDQDGDGYSGREDCDDESAAVNPGVATDGCNGVDDDCDGETDENPTTTWHADADGDGFGAAAGTAACEAPAGAVSNGIDCDDADASAHPDGTERCNGADDDCDGAVDNDAQDGSTWPLDADGDGAGSPTETVSGCTLPENGAENTYDCDDSDASEPSFADPAGGRSGDGSIDRPYGTIGSALTAGARCVAVMPGTYAENLEVSGRVWIYGVAGSADTSLQTTVGGSVIATASGSNLTLEGLTLSGGTGTAVVTEDLFSSGGTDYYTTTTTTTGGGLHLIDTTFTGRDLVVEDNDPGGYSSSYTSGVNAYYTTIEQGLGGGIYAENSTITLEDVTVQGNQAYIGSGIYVSGGTLDAVRLDVSGNDGDQLTIWVDGAKVDLDAFRMMENTSSSGSSGTQFGGSDVSIRNATIVGNDIAVYLASGTMRLWNSIVFDNTYGVADTENGNASWDMGFNDIYGNEADFYGLTSPVGFGGNVAVDPMFVSWRRDTMPNDRVTLDVGSPLIDAGDPAVLDVDGSRSDMGMYGGPAGSW